MYPKLEQFLSLKSFFSMIIQLQYEKDDYNVTSKLVMFQNGKPNKETK